MKKELTVRDIVYICNAKLFCGNESIKLKTFSKDTRTIKNNDTFIGIKGNSFDGNLLYKEAFEKGANCAILEESKFKIDNDYVYDKPIILVKDSIDALRKIALYIRSNSDALFVAVTGSVGKTSTRDMIYSVVSKEYNTLKTDGNYNNNIGLPLTIMKLKDEECAIIEMGMNNLGEIDYLTNIVKPNLAVITNVGTAHIGNLGSRKNILKAKLEIRNGLQKDGKLIINNDNDLLHEYYLKNNKDIITIGINNNSDIMAKNIVIDNKKSIFKIVYNNKEFDAICPVPSISYIYNSLIAFAVGIKLNIPYNKIIKGIRNYELPKNRLDIINIKNNIKVINDCYNASVDSMKSSLDILNNIKGKRKIAVLGSMLELGKHSKKLHQEIGEYVNNLKIDALLTIGDEAKNIYITANNIKDKHHFNNNNEIINKLKIYLKKGDVLLIKASNGLKLIEIVNELKKW